MDHLKLIERAMSDYNDVYHAFFCLEKRVHLASVSVSQRPVIPMGGAPAQEAWGR